MRRFVARDLTHDNIWTALFLKVSTTNVLTEIGKARPNPDRKRDSMLKMLKTVCCIVKSGDEIMEFTNEEILLLKEACESKIDMYEHLLTIGVDNSSPTKPDVKQAIIAQQKVSKYEMLKQKLGY